MSNSKKKTQSTRLKANNSPSDTNPGTQTQPTEQLDTGNLDKVRDIIFGHQMRDYEKKFTRLEDRIIKLSSELRDEINNRFDTLEEFTKKELADLNDHQNQEQTERVKNVKDIARQIQNLIESNEKEFGKLAEQLSNSQRESREQILNQSKRLSEEIHIKNKELNDVLENAVNELRADKLDRSSLASMLQEMAMRINNEFHLTTSEDLTDSEDE